MIRMRSATVWLLLAKLAERCVCFLLLAQVESSQSMIPSCARVHNRHLNSNCIIQLCSCVVQVESSQSMIRIVGLSATLPNYRDVARFLGVNNDTGKSTLIFSAAVVAARNRGTLLGRQQRHRWVLPGGMCAVNLATHEHAPPACCNLTPPTARDAVHVRLGQLPAIHMPSNAGLFYFDASYRPVPLEMQFVGVSERNVLARLGIMDEVCYQKVGWGVAAVGITCVCFGSQRLIAALS